VKSEPHRRSGESRNPGNYTGHRRPPV
jgi:hypothetical protein